MPRMRVPYKGVPLKGNEVAFQPGNTLDGKPIMCAACKLVYGPRHRITYWTRVTPLSAKTALCAVCGKQGQVGYEAPSMWLPMRDDPRLVCDCCSKYIDGLPVEYICEVFGYDLLGFRNMLGPEWDFCAACAKLVEAHDIPAMVAQGVGGYMVKRGQKDADNLHLSRNQQFRARRELARSMEGLYRSFFDHLRYRVTDYEGNTRLENQDAEDQ